MGLENALRDSASRVKVLESGKLRVCKDEDAVGCGKRELATLIYVYDP
jgi:hypothetical protein